MKFIRTFSFFLLVLLTAPRCTTAEAGYGPGYWTQDGGAVASSGWTLRHSTGEITGSSGTLGDLGTTTINGITVTQRGTPINFATTANGLVLTRNATGDGILTWDIADIIDDYEESQGIAMVVRAEVTTHPNVNSFLFLSGLMDTTNERVVHGPYSRGVNLFDYDARRHGVAGGFEDDAFLGGGTAPPAYVTWVSFLTGGTGVQGRYSQGGSSIAIPAAEDLATFGTVSENMGKLSAHSYTQLGLYAYFPSAGEIRIHEVAFFTR